MMEADIFFQGLVRVLDYFVVLLSLLATGYLIYNFNTFYRKYVVASYILVLSLFSFGSVRWVLHESPVVDSAPFLATSFLMDVLVVTFAASIIYHFERLGDVKYVRKLFGLQKIGDGEIIEYGGPELEDIEPGRSYLVLEEGFSYDWRLLAELSTHLPTLCFTRKHPAKLDIHTEGRDLEFYWLSESDVESYENVIEPFRRGEIQEKIIDFVNNHRNPVIMIAGLEYLIYKNSPEAMVEFMQHLNDELAHRRDAIIIYALDRGGVPDKAYALFKEEVDEVRWMDEHGTIERRDY